MDLSLIPDAILSRVFTPLVEWPHENVQHNNPPAYTSSTRRTCDRCNDADGQVLWYGAETVCPWCGWDTSDLRVD